MIDEKKLIEELRHHLLEYKEDDIAIGINVVREIINNQPKIGEWILCSERLPVKTGRYYIVSVKSTVSDLEYTRPTLYDNDGFATKLDEEPIAWQPLPESYKEVEQ